MRGLEAAGWMVVVAIVVILFREGKELFIPLVIALIGAYHIKVLEGWIGNERIASMACLHRSRMITPRGAWPSYEQTHPRTPPR